jgi:predicted  nucleic acid-binding Zn-ribbon protein
VEEYKEQVKDLSAQVTGFASDNKEFREKIDQYDKDNAAMKNDVAATVARVDSLAERTDSAEAAIKDLQAGQAQTVKDIAALESKDADLQRQITSNDTDISAIQAKDREQDARLDAIETVNDAQAASITQNTQNIARNTQNIQDNAANIAINSKELAKHAAQLKDHDAQLAVLHKETSDNHQAIERLTSVTDGLRADLTEDEAKIAQNADAIAHIQQKDVEQDGRLDALENRATAAEGRLDALDTKTDATNAALKTETDRAKAAELANGQLIAKNAQELAKHADELSDHERRITALETDNDTNKQDIADIKAKDAAQDAIVGDWATAHPDQTITECVASMETELGEHAGDIAALQTDKANKTDIPDVSDFATHAEVKAVDDKVGAGVKGYDNLTAATEYAIGRGVMAVTVLGTTSNYINRDVSATIGNWKKAYANETMLEVINKKANAADLPSLDGYATKTYVDTQDAARVPLLTGTYQNDASSVAMGVLTHTTDAPDVWTVTAMFPYPVFVYKHQPDVNVDTLKGKLHLYKPDGTEVAVANWVTTGNVNGARGVLGRLSSNFTPDVPFYVVVYRNNSDAYTTAGDVPIADSTI